MISLAFTICFLLLLKLNIMLLSSVLEVILVVNIHQINSLNYLLPMEPFIKLLVLTLLNKMELLKGNIALLLKLLVLFYCLPLFLVGKFVLTIVHVINKIPSSVTLGLSPFENLYGCLLEYSALIVFGSTCFVLCPRVERSKLSSQSAICFFLGYGDGQRDTIIMVLLAKKFMSPIMLCFLNI